jgi:hypothetical protein
MFSLSEVDSGGYRETQHGDRIGLLLFFQNKESKLMKFLIPKLLLQNFVSMACLRPVCNLVKVNHTYIYTAVIDSTSAFYINEHPEIFSSRRGRKNFQ